MEKATFIEIARNKKGELYGRLQFANGGTMPVPKSAKLDESLLNQECEVLRKKGVIARIVVNEKEIFSKTAASSYQNRQRHHKGQTDFKQNQRGHGKEAHGKRGVVQNSGNKKQTGAAWAPYNFIPLNQTIVEGQALPPLDVYQKTRFTGYIACQLETLTPLYIRDTYTPEELIKKEQGKENPDFFSPGNEIKIPGSSLRGMIRNLIEIIGWSKFGFFEDKLLFYRGLTDECTSFRDEYKEKMSPGEHSRKTIYQFNAGYLQKEGIHYYIIPAKTVNGNQFNQMEKRRNNNIEFVVEKQHDGKYLVIPGNAPGKKNKGWIINPPDYSKEKIPVPKKDICIYNLDDNRYEDQNKKHDGNLMRQLSSFTEKIVPCFYVRWKDSQKKDRIYLGHTRYFRLPYDYTIGDYLPKLNNLFKNDLPDFVETIFGSSKKKYSSRLFFEDAKLLPGQQNVVSEMPKVPQILAEPKPTTFQHYLEPEGDRPSHWNSKRYNAEITIRGNKLYWHRNNPGWELDKQNMEKASEKFITQIRPVKTGTLFKFKIRYENLTNEELGLLLFALALPEGHYHKLGLGKPLGLGTVKLTPKLYISNRQERYSKLFEENNWYLGEKTSDVEPFKKAFEKYLLNILKKQEKFTKDSLWDVDRMHQLKTMLNWENTKIPNWLDKTRYMEIEPVNNPDESEFKNRLLLPKPEELPKLGGNK